MVSNTNGWQREKPEFWFGMSEKAALNTGLVVGLPVAATTFVTGINFISPGNQRMDAGASLVYLACAGGVFWIAGKAFMATSILTFKILQKKSAKR